jgi:hypothetical protein
MNASSAASAQEPVSGARWLLLIHHLPPKPDYLRVKVRRRLQKIGAAALKSSVYVLPDTDEALEDFTWLAREIEGDGGTAMLCHAAFIDGITDEEIEAMLHSEDHVADREARSATGTDQVEPGRTWVTRTGVKVDRISSAWLIRRFIDPEPRFKFVPPRGYIPEPGELRFDMYEAEYAHEGDRCTFQTLVARFGLRDPALRAIGEIVHDIDCKDEQFGRPETAGIASLVRGIAQATDDDPARIERGSAILDDLYAAFQASGGRAASRQ